MTNRSQFDRRTMASDIKHLSILESRCKISDRRQQKLKGEMIAARFMFKLTLIGVCASYLFFISEVMK